MVLLYRTPDARAQGAVAAFTARSLIAVPWR